MNEKITQATSGGDFYIWAVMFGMLVIGVGYLAYISKDYEEK
nr:hypothetical protein [Sulfurimonas sp. SAG-AH-194-C20]